MLRCEGTAISELTIKDRRKIKEDGYTSSVDHAIVMLRDLSL